MKSHLTAKSAIALAALAMTAAAEAAIPPVAGPDGRLSVSVSLLPGGRPAYSVTYDGKTILEPSPLGLTMTTADLSSGLALASVDSARIDKEYSQDRIKRSRVHYVANERTYTFADTSGRRLAVTFRVADNDFAFRYSIPSHDGMHATTVTREHSGFDFPAGTTTFLTPQAVPMTGWRGSKPSYEEEYALDAPLGTPSQHGRGYTFPGLFRIGSDGWALVSETGVTSRYCASRLSEGSADGLFTVEYPMPEENNGIGSANPSISLPGCTPWRTVTVGADLAPIVQTTVPFDLVDPLYEAGADYRPGKGTWSWILWQDASINYDDQLRYIDLAAAMGYPYVLIDNYWDRNIGRDRMADLARYAADRGVSLLLWYSSNGLWNHTDQSPLNIMCSSIDRKREMKWLRDLGVKGIKVDFFGGDKQQTMQLYEDILSDANDHGLMVIFHGCTLPRGWERMYPNYVGSEAVLASENFIFDQHFCDVAAANAALHPFIRNAVGSMEFGGTVLNKRMHREPDKGNLRRTSDVAELAMAVLFQSPAQNFALAPGNLTDAPALCLDFMREVPTAWDETLLIDGYPGRYAVVARRSGDRWYVGGINATAGPLQLDLRLPMLAGRSAALYRDKYAKGAERDLRKTGRLTLATDFEPVLESVKVDADGIVPVTILPQGGIVITSK